MVELLTYNTHFGKKIDRIGNWIRSLPKLPDIMCFQEFPKQYIDAARLPLPGAYQYRYAPVIERRGRIYGELTAYHTRKTKLIGTRTVDLELSPLEKKFFRFSGERNGLLTTFAVSGKPFSVVNLHLPWLLSHRRRRVLLGNLIRNLNLSGLSHAVVLAGDFNYTSLAFGNGLLRYMEKHGFRSGGRLPTHRLLGLRQQIDYVFHKNCTVLEMKTDNIRYSDHWPVFAKVHVN